MTAESDEFLSVYTRTGDGRDFARVVDAYGNMVCRVCVRILGNGADAEEMTQETFLALARNARQVRTSVGGWLHARASTLCLTRLEREGNRRKREKAYGSGRQAQQTSVEVTWEELRPEVDAVLAELPRELHEILVAYFLERREEAEIARERGVSASTVSRRISAGLEAMRTGLERRGVIVGAAALGTVLMANTSAGASPAALAASLGKVALAVGKPAGASWAAWVVWGVVGAALVAGAAAIYLATETNPGAMPTVVATASAPATTTRSATMDVILEGVPRVGYDTHPCPLGGSLFSCLTYLGEKPDYDELMAVSGSAFRRFYNRGDGGNVDEMRIGFEPVRRALGNAGWVWRHVPPQREAMKAAIVESLSAGHPVIGFGALGGPPAACVIAGIKDDGKTLLGWSYFGARKEPYHQNSAWMPAEQEGLGVVILERKTSRPVLRRLLVDTLRYAIDLQRSARWPAYPEHVAGIAACEAYARDLEVDADFPDDEKLLDQRGMIAGDQASMVYDRKHAAVWLRRMASEFSEAAAELMAAADLYGSIGAQATEAWPGGLEFMGSQAQARIGDKQTRHAMAAAYRKIATEETEAAEHLERAIAILSPAPERAELKAPTPEELNKGGRRAPEDMALPTALRAALDLLGGNPTGRAPNSEDAGPEWRVDPNQTLMMAATSEAFCFPWIVRPWQKEVGFAFLPHQERSVEAGLRAMGMQAKVTLHQDLALPRPAELEAVALRGLPVILVMKGRSNYLLVTGYEAGGETVMGWEASGGGPQPDFARGSQVRVSDWAKTVRGAIVFTMPARPTSLDKTLAAALADGIAMMKRQELGPWYNNAAMHAAWANAMLDEKLDGAPARGKRQELLLPAMWDLAERRWYGSLFLKQAAQAFPAAGEELRGAARDFMAIHDLMYAINREAGGAYPGDPAMDPATAEVRKKIAGLMKEAKARDDAALGKMEAARMIVEREYRSASKSGA